MDNADSYYCYWIYAIYSYNTEHLSDTYNKKSSYR